MSSPHGPANPWRRRGARSGRARRRGAEGAGSGDLGFGPRGDFRIAFADHAVAAVALGGVETAVGALDERMGRVPVPDGGDADRDRDAAEMLAARTLHQFLAHHGATDLVADRDRLAQRGARQHHRELLAAVAGRDVLALDVLLDREGDEPKNLAARKVAESVFDDLEVIG